MVFNANIFRCQSCGYRLLSEEIETHECLQVTDYRLEDDLLWISDGKRWYPIKRQPQMNNPKRTTEDGTEQMYSFCSKLGCP
jgi:hypothetical protein